MLSEADVEELVVRIYGGAGPPTLIYLPGLHGDWTLITSFRQAIGNRARFVEVTYPRSLTWSVEDYRDAVASGLAAHGVDRGWLIGESWGSQVAWALLEDQPRPFRPQGLILAGGFVKHPWAWGPRLVKWMGLHTPMRIHHLILSVYGLSARLRHDHPLATSERAKEFISRRTEEDRKAMCSRLDLLGQQDPRPIARRTKVSVWCLNGFVDPLVPWPVVRRWLRGNCPGYRGGRIFWSADHNVLATAPQRAADQILQWIAAESGQS
jgi:pimeloyl-ACP methyl ester carboxylesterase